MELNEDLWDSKECKERFLKVYQENNLSFAAYNWLLTNDNKNKELKEILNSLDLKEEDKLKLYYYAKKLKGSLKGLANSRY